MTPAGGSLSFERIADRYDETRGGENRGRRFAAHLAGMLDPAQPVVEIGVGTGVVATGLQDLGYRVIGLDLAGGMLARARRRIGPRVAAADARRLPLRDGSVSQALSVWVLHVVGDVAHVLAEVARILSPGGRYLVVPASGDRPQDDPIGAAIWDMQVRLVHDYEESPAQAIRKIETGSYSALWDLPGETWRRAVEPTLQELRSLPDPDRPIPRRSTDRVVVMGRSS